MNNKVEQDRALLASVQGKGFWPKLGVFTKLSGPGWLQSAITLGGGSLAGALYIGVIGGYGMLWLQPLMMILGVIMLSAIAYVTLSTGEKPFHAINKHVNPVLGWGWLIAAMIANLVWAMPQFSLGTAAMQQNLGLPFNDVVCSLILLVIAGTVIWFYDAGGWGIKLFEIILKIMVALIVLAFFGVVAALTFKGALPWGEVLLGFVPDFSLLYHPAEQLRPYIEASSDAGYWTTKIVAIQRDTMIAAAATAVGINMTFLLPYSMLRKGWDKTFRGLATFDLSTGLFIPFVLATSCVVIAAASQFHAKYDAGLVGESEPTAMTPMLQGEYDKNLKEFAAAQIKMQDENAFKQLQDEQKEHDEELKQAKANLASTLAPEQYEAKLKEDKTLGMGSGPLNEAITAYLQSDKTWLPDKQLAVMTIKSDSGPLAMSLENVTGSKAVAQYVFGIGVVGMAISTIIILMLINGFTFTEALGVKTSGTMHRVGSYLPALTGFFGFLLIWGPIPEARFWLAIPTSRIGMMLLPVAYITFFLMLNSRKIMGEHLPTGGKRVAANAVMLVAIAVATYGCGLTLWTTSGKFPGTEIQAQPVLIGLAAAFIALAVIVQVIRMGKKNA